MDRDTLANAARRYGNDRQLERALRTYFATDAGRTDLAHAPGIQTGEGTRPMTVDDAVPSLLEEARTLRPKGA